MFRKTSTLLLALCLSFLFACNNEEDQAVIEREAAYTAYKDFVATFEQDSLTEVELRALQQSIEDDSRWETESAEIDQQFLERKGRVIENLGDYSPEQQEEIANLEERYNLAKQRRQQQYEEAGMRYALLGVPVINPDLSNITTENIADTYERFTSTLADNAANYEGREWEMVEGWWNSLNNRYQALLTELSAAELSTIEQAQDRYLELREQYYPPNQ
ncbi:hypothetical protein CLV24_104236 [Pontibacter ummariensis]|uniref:DUF3450 domain-containing protein n=1 Tax=Pontibacter ummariensis TaxID=1610492 RepID=A0A239DJ19_9BACT|nr:hypothetical protein [Pontibacter ummariensis]PRY14423.1 hypothetical protein CLV24_104236 [Pontibacter ummariensis]SNS31654.1 hypothetical protein SAMN06296052_104235 [Pontibacter ummariensis]